MMGRGGGPGGAESAHLFLFLKTIVKVIRLSTVLIFFLLSGSCEGPYYGLFSRVYLSICNGHIRQVALREKLPLKTKDQQSA